MLPVFFINMGSRPDRLLHVERQLSTCGLAGTRVEAVTPRDFPPELKGQRERSTPSLADGELACSLSHRKIWRLMLDQAMPAALILEDDVVLASDIGTVLSDPHLLDHDTDAIQLEAHATAALVGRPRQTALAGVTLNRLMSSSLGSAAYVMTSRLAARLLVRGDLDAVPLDSLLFGRQGGVFYEARILQAVPALAIQLDHTAAGRQEAGRSDLTPQRASSRHEGRSRPLAARLARAARHWGNHLRVVTTFGISGDLWGARHLRLPVTPDLQSLL
jgi:glycosyl transferase family 25